MKIRVGWMFFPLPNLCTGLNITNPGLSDKNDFTPSYTIYREREGIQCSIGTFRGRTDYFYYRITNLSGFNIIARPTYKFLIYRVAMLFRQ